MDTKSLIDAIGGQPAIAKHCGLTVAAVSLWNVNGIPESWGRYLRLTYPGAHWKKYDAWLSKNPLPRAKQAA